jgi:diguanylate cyclase (GGDEF)-like protein
MGISYKVLIIDDEEMIRNLLVSLFSEHGHNCETAQDGIEALEKIKKNSFDVAVIDIVMAPMDGITLTKELAKLNPNLPIMIMTGYADEHSAKLAIEAGAREFIKKPFSIDEFIIRFDKMMRHHMGEKELLALSLTDELTGLYNRRRFFVLTEQYLKVAHRTKKRSLLLYIDLDNLKWINDHFGHHGGDQALINFATILKKTFRESDIIARIGGDEFVVLLESTDENDEILITHLYENIKDYNAKRFRHYNLSISVGTAQFDPEYPISIDELLSKADALMYAQKREKKGILQRNHGMRVEAFNNREKRSHPRFSIDLPLEYRDMDNSHTRGAIVVNASETGFLIESGKDIPIGTELNIAVLYLKGFELANFKVTGKIVWKEPYSKEDWKGEPYWKGYQYGLEFTQILDEDRWKLNPLLSGRYIAEEVSYNL